MFFSTQKETSTDGVEVSTSVWSGINYNKDFTFFDTSRVWTFDGILYVFFETILGLCTMQEPSYLGKTALIYKASLTLTYIPSRYRYLSGFTILIPTGSFFDTIIDVDY